MTPNFFPFTLTIIWFLCGSSALAEESLWSLESWHVRHSHDDFSKRDTISAFTVAEKALATPHRRDPEKKVAFLLIDCEAGAVYAWLNVRKTLVFGHSGTLQIKFDEEAPQLAPQWEGSTDYTSAGLPRGAKSLAFAKRLLAAKTVQFRLQDSVFGQTDLSFSLRGYSEAIAKVNADSKCKIR